MDHVAMVKAMPARLAALLVQEEQRFRRVCETVRKRAGFRPAGTGSGPEVRGQGSGQRERVRVHGARGQGSGQRETTAS